MKHFVVAALLLVIASISAPRLHAEGRFVWGAEVGSGIDMSSDDMSTLDIAAYLGVSMPWLDVAAIGAGIDNYMSNSSNTYPIFALLRSSFGPRPRLLFGEIRVGVGLNRIDSRADQTGLYLRPGLGFRLAHSSKFSSYLMLSYLYNSVSFPSPKVETTIHGVNQAVISLGITF
ncbi:MAG: porin family protein [Duncaniella sp.]|nr:porin family protein [Duncaniella sp.]